MDSYEQMNTEIVDNALDLVRNKWYSDRTDARCPHDSWVDKIEIAEVFSGGLDQVRSITIKICLLNAFHNGSIIFIYENVLSYSLTTLRLSQRGNRAHGDWMEDRVDVIMEPRSLLHQISLSSGANICIVCASIRYEASWDSASIL